MCSLEHIDCKSSGNHNSSKFFALRFSLGMNTDFRHHQIRLYPFTVYLPSSVLLHINIGNQGHLSLLTNSLHFLCAGTWNIFSLRSYFVEIFSLLILSSPTRAVYNRVPSICLTFTESPCNPQCTGCISINHDWKPSSSLLRTGNHTGGRKPGINKA